MLFPPSVCGDVLHHEKLCLRKIKGFNRLVLIFCFMFFFQDAEKMGLLREAVAAQTKYTILVTYFNLLYIFITTLAFKGNIMTYLLSFSGYYRDGNRQSLTRTTWNCTGVEDGEARNIQRRSLSHQQSVHSLYKSGIVITELKQYSNTTIILKLSAIVTRPVVQPVKAVVERPLAVLWAP